MQLIPARGRLLAFAPLIDLRSRMQLIPARGRLLNYSTLSLILPVDAAYPREGTVTKDTCTV